MKRTVEFRDNGDIVITGEKSRDVIHQGVALLTKEEADEAVHWGWKIEGGPYHSTTPPLYRVRR
jgi:hypothetical protein